jgi:hypothetical protein
MNSYTKFLIEREVKGQGSLITLNQLDHAEEFCAEFQAAYATYCDLNRWPTVGVDYTSAIWAHVSLSRQRLVH